MAQYKSFPPKDPTAKLDYVFDWASLTNHRGLSDWLLEGETISSYTVVVPEGLVKVSDQLINGNTAVLVWIEGGTEDEEYPIQCNIVTNQGREDTRSSVLPVKLR